MFAVRRKKSEQTVSIQSGKHPGQESNGMRSANLCFNLFAAVSFHETDYGDILSYTRKRQI